MGIRAALRIPSRLFAITAAALLVPIVPYVVIGELPGDRWLSASDTNAWLFSLASAGLLASDVLLPVPSSIVGTLAGARLGFIAGWPCVWLGLTLGHVIGFLAGRLALGGLGAHAPKAPTLLILFASRPVPILAEATTIVAGAAGTRFWPFLAVCGAGNALYALALAGNGTALLPEAWIGWGLAIPLSVPAIGWLVWRRFVRRAERTPQEREAG